MNCRCIIFVAVGLSELEFIELENL